MALEQHTRVVDAPVKTTQRLAAVDALRGLLIIFMALDHANHFVAQKHSASEIWNSCFLSWPGRGAPSAIPAATGSVAFRKSRRCNVMNASR